MRLRTFSCCPSGLCDSSSRMVRHTLLDDEAMCPALHCRQSLFMQTYRRSLGRRTDFVASRSALENGRHTVISFDSVAAHSCQRLASARLVALAALKCVGYSILTRCTIAPLHFAYDCVTCSAALLLQSTMRPRVALTLPAAAFLHSS